MVSEVQPKLTCQVHPTPTLPVQRLNLRNLFLHGNRHINSFVSVLILANLDVLGLPIDLLPGWWVSFLCAIFLMIWDFSTSTLLTTCSFTEFDDISPQISGFGIRLRYHVRFQVYDYTCCLKHVLTQDLSLSCCRSSVVVSRSLCRATHGLPFRAPVYRGCACRDPPVCHRVQGDCGKAPTLLCVVVGVVGVVTVCVLCACSWSCFTLMCN